MNKNKLIIALFGFGIFLPLHTQLLAVTIIDPEEAITATATKTEFGLSGVINIYVANESIIVINGIRYLLDSKGSLADKDLTKGQKVKFNAEQSSTDYIGRITRIWIED
jgi:hypothetical protein